MNQDQPEATPLSDQDKVRDFTQLVLLTGQQLTASPFSPHRSDSRGSQSSSSPPTPLPAPLPPQAPPLPSLKKRRPFELLCACSPHPPRRLPDLASTQAPTPTRSPVPSTSAATTKPKPITIHPAGTSARFPETFAAWEDAVVARILNVTLNVSWPRVKRVGVELTRCGCCSGTWRRSRAGASPTSRMWRRRLPRRNPVRPVLHSLIAGSQLIARSSTNPPEAELGVVRSPPARTPLPLARQHNRRPGDHHGRGIASGERDGVRVPRWMLEA